MKTKTYMVIDIDENEFMAVTKAINKINLQARPVGYYHLLIDRLKKEEILKTLKEAVL